MALPQVGLEAVIENLAGFSKGATQITKAYDQIDTGASKVEKSSAGLSGVFSSVGSGLLSVGKVAAAAAVGGVALLGGGLVALGTKSVLAAADVGEMQSLFNTAFEQDAPKARAEIDEFAAAVGRNKFELEGFAGGIKSLVTPMGVTAEAGNEMSIGFSKLAVDLSSFFNVTESDALDSLRSGLIGETEPLRKFGIVLNEAAIKQKALNMGIFDGKGNMDAATKASATYALIMEQTKMAQGDAARTSGSWVNQTRALKSAIDEATVEIGMQLIPVLTPLLQQFTAMVKQYLPQLVEWFKVNLPIAIQTAKDTWASLQPVIAQVQEIISLFFENLNDSRGVVYGITGALASLADNILLIFGIDTDMAIYDFMGSLADIVQDSVIPAIQEIVRWFKTDLPAGSKKVQSALKPVIDKILPQLVDIFNVVYKWTIKNWPLIQKTIVTVMRFIWEEIKAVTKAIGYIWENWGDEIIDVVVIVFKMVKTNLENMLDVATLIMQLITGDWKGAWETIKGIADRNLGEIFNLIKIAFNNMLKSISDTMASIKNKISEIWASIVGTIKDKVNEAYSIVKSKFDSLASLISSYASSLLAAAKTMMQGIINGINSMLSSITSALNSVMTSAINSLKNAITSGSLYSILISAGQAIINAIKAGINAITDLAGQLIAKVQAAINTLSSAISGGTLYNILSGIGQKIISTIRDAATSVTDFVSSIQSKLEEWIGKLLNSNLIKAIQSVGEDIVEEILNGFEGSENVFDLARDSIKEWILSWFSPIPEARHAGNEIVNNVLAGFYARRNKFITSARMGLNDWLAQASTNLSPIISPTLSTQLQSAIAGPAVNAPALGATGNTSIFNTFQLGGNTINSGMDQAQFEARVMRAIRRNL